MPNDNDKTVIRQPDGSYKVAFTLDGDIQVVCHHCNSGWVILTLGVKQGKAINVAACTLSVPGHPLYCPYCGRDMKD